MGQSAVELPDPLEPPPGDVAGTDDLLAQMAGEEIDRLLAEAEVEPDGSPDVAPPAAPVGAATPAALAEEPSDAPSALQAAAAPDAAEPSANDDDDDDPLAGLPPPVVGNLDEALLAQAVDIAIGEADEPAAPAPATGLKRRGRAPARSPPAADDPRIGDGKFDAHFAAAEVPPAAAAPDAPPAPTAEEAPAGEPTPPPAGDIPAPAEPPGTAAAEGEAETEAEVDPVLARQLDTLFTQLNGGERRARPADSAGAVAHAGDDITATARERADGTTDDDLAAGATTSAERAALGLPADERAPGVTPTDEPVNDVDEQATTAAAGSSDDAADGLDERTPLYIRILEWLNAPLDAFPESVRDVIGKVAILTLLNAAAILIYVKFVRR